MLVETSPVSERQLLQRSLKLAGKTIGQLASSINADIPQNLQREKGWQGQLIETLLGVTDTTYAGPDFPELGIEVKTIPLDHRGLPKESTYVCSIELSDLHNQTWEQSLVYRKLKKVLWIPVQASAEISLAERRIGTPLLWSPTTEQASVLRADWEEHMEKISLGRIAEITAHMGNWLQVRPKAASGKIRRKASDEKGVSNNTLPRGFYLRSVFTTSILQNNFL